MGPLGPRASASCCFQLRPKWLRFCPGHEEGEVTMPAVDTAVGGVLVPNPPGQSSGGNVLETEMGVGQAWN